MRISCAALAVFAAMLAVAPSAMSADALTGATVKAAVTASALPDDIDAVTSASVVPQRLRQQVPTKAFTDAPVKKVLMIVGDPRHESVEWDLVATAAKHFIDRGLEVEVRDLYAIGFNPVLPRETFFHAKDGFGETPADVAIEQKYVAAADHLVFCYPNWHDSPNAITKGYMERVFSKQFAYRDAKDGLEGLLGGKTVYTIMNAGWIGMGRGDVGDGVVPETKAVWDRYLNAYKVVDDDTAAFWGARNLGRFVNDRTPGNLDPDYAAKLDGIHAALVDHLDRKFGL